MAMVEINGMKVEVTMDELKQLVKTKSAKKKSSINGAPLTAEPIVAKAEKDGVEVLVFKHKDYGRREYALADIKTASVLIEAQQFADTNRHTGTRFVRLENGRSIGENLVQAAQRSNLL